MWANISDRNSHCGDQTCLFRHDHSCSLVTLVSHGLLPLHSLVTSHYDTSNMQYPAFERCTLKQSTSKSQSQKKVSCSTCIMEDHKMPAPTKMEEFCSCWHCCCCNSFFLSLFFTLFLVVMPMVVTLFRHMGGNCQKGRLRVSTEFEYCEFAHCMHAVWYSSTKAVVRPHNEFTNISDFLKTRCDSVWSKYKHFPPLFWHLLALLA